MLWDFTCPDTLAASHIQDTSAQACAAAISAEQYNATKYAAFSPSYEVVPVAIETLGAWGPSAWEFVCSLGRRLVAATGDSRAGAFLRQRLSIAVQRGNAAAVRGTQTHLAPPPLLKTRCP